MFKHEIKAFVEIGKDLFLEELKTSEVMQKAVYIL